MALSDIVSQLAPGVRVSTAITPSTTYRYDPDSPPSWFTKLLKPQIEFVTNEDSVLSSSAPYGVPDSPDSWLPLLGVLVLVLGLVGAGGYFVGKAIE